MHEAVPKNYARLEKLSGVKSDSNTALALYETTFTQHFAVFFMAIYFYFFLDQKHCGQMLL